MTTRTYVGAVPAGRVDLPSRSPLFERNVPLEVTDEEAALLDDNDEWITPKQPRQKKSQPTEPTPDPQGSEPEPQEP